ncbi:MAG TPA: TIGR02757 family protein [Candidatus Hydrogenedentes bacterium]|nr:TIGR02757 family protein [Candidatus Hydrogenedentota bacterium]
MPDFVGPAEIGADIGTLRDRLRRLYRRYHRPDYIDTDPLSVVYDYSDAADRELAGLVAAGLAFGDAKQIQRAARSALGRLGPEPASSLLRMPSGDIRRLYAAYRYRWVSGSDMAAFLLGVRRLLEENGTIQAAVARSAACEQSRRKDPEFLRHVLVNWSRQLFQAMDRAWHPLWPDPERGGACKRMLLYLRWMVRRDRVDPGCWTVLSPAQLLCPVDRHIHRLALAWGITRRKNADWKTSVEITRVFRTLCPGDPCRWDFALTRAAMLGGLPSEWTVAAERTDQVAT